MPDRTFIVAEIANAHGKNLEVCLDALRSAKLAGADAFKVATYKPSHLTIKCDRDEFKLNHPVWSSFGDLWSLYDHIHMPWDFHEPIFRKGKELGIEVFSSPFSQEAVDYLEEEFDPNYHKVASMEAVHYPFIEYLAKTNKRILVSTGKSSSIKEILRVVDILKRLNKQRPVIFHCTSEYPAPISKANLNAIVDLKKVFGEDADIGLSDHSDGILIPMLGVAIGANFIEKHITLSKDEYFPNGMRNPDVEFSITPDYFEAMCIGIRSVEEIKNNNNLSLKPIDIVRQVLNENKSLMSFISAHEMDNIELAFGQYTPNELPDRTSGGLRRSLLFIKDVKKGEPLKLGLNYDILRPGHGLHPLFLEDIDGLTLALSAKKGEGVKFIHVNK